MSQNDLVLSHSALSHLPGCAEFGDFSAGESIEFLRDFRAFGAEVKVVDFNASGFAAFGGSPKHEFVEIKTHHTLTLLQTGSLEVHELVQSRRRRRGKRCVKEGKEDVYDEGEKIEGRTEPDSQSIPIAIIYLKIQNIMNNHHY